MCKVVGLTPKQKKAIKACAKCETKKDLGLYLCCGSVQVMCKCNNAGPRSTDMANGHTFNEPKYWEHQAKYDSGNTKVRDQVIQKWNDLQTVL